jgi:hypothetical protein
MIGGGTVAEHSRAVARARAARGESVKAAESTAVACPAALRRAWDAFLDLSRRRGRGFGAQPIQYADLMAYRLLTGIRIDPVDVFAIMSLDNVFLTIDSESANG